MPHYPPADRARDATRVPSRPHPLPCEQWERGGRARRLPGPCRRHTYLLHTAQLMPEDTSVQPVPGDHDVEPSFIARLPVLPVMVAA